MFTFDNTVHIAEIFIMAGIAWPVIRAANRIMDVLKDFPPHRHVNGKIIFPKGFQPSESEELGAGRT